MTDTPAAPANLDEALRKTITARCWEADGGADGYALNDYGDALLAVLDLHPAEVVGENPARCGSCVDSYEDPVLYPCRTVAAIATALGVSS